MNNVISVSGGNDSKAMLLTIGTFLERYPELFVGDTWNAIYCDTGWGKSTWQREVEITKGICAKIGIPFTTLKANANNTQRKTSNNVMFETVPEEQQYGMTAFIKKKRIFPYRGMKYCTEKLKIIPILKFMQEKGFTPDNTMQWIGIRREEGGRLGGSVNLKDRSNACSIDTRSGYTVIYPIVYMGSVERDMLLKRNHIAPLNTRSEECHPCIFQYGIKDLATIEPARVELIADLEHKITKVKQAQYDLMGATYPPDMIWGMFNYKKCGGVYGIKAQRDWALSKLKERGKKRDTANQKYLVDDKCSSGYCGT